MRLTLRTLLAYMNDALDPHETRVIGKKVAESEKTQHLARRIQRLVRRRRLTAPDYEPAAAGGNDANAVAEYLDNTLPEPQVRGLERRCQEDDVALAEVAAAHQILSRVLGEPVEVSPESRQRIYKAAGIHSSTPTKVTPVGPTPNGHLAAAPNGGVAAEDVAMPIPAFPESQSFASRLGVWALVAALMIGLVAVSWQALSTPNDDRLAFAGTGAHAAPKPGPVDVGPAPADKPVDKPAPEATASKKAPEADAATKTAPTKEAVPPKNDKGVVRDQADPGKERSKLPEMVEKAKTDAAKKSSTPDVVAMAPAPDIRRNPPPAPKPSQPQPEAAKSPTTPVAKYMSTKGALFRLSESGPERLQTSAEVASGQMLVNLDGSRSTLSVAATNETIEMVDQGRLQIAEGWRLTGGRLKIETGAPNAAVRLQLEDETVTVATPGDKGLLAVQFLPPSPGAKVPKPPALLLTAVRGQFKVADGRQSVNLDAGWQLEVSKGGIGTAHAEDPPAWLGAGVLSPAEQKVADRLMSGTFIPFGSAGVIGALQSAMADNRTREGRRYVVRSLAALDDFPTVVDALRDEKAADVRQTALNSLRSVVRQNQARVVRLKDALLNTFTAAETDNVLALLRGFPASAAEDEKLLRDLVGLLTAESIAFRELGIVNLRELTGKDFGYNAGDTQVRRNSIVKIWSNYLDDRQ